MLKQDDKHDIAITLCKSKFRKKVNTKIIFSYLFNKSCGIIHQNKRI